MSVPDNRRNLLLVDNTVSNYTQIVNSVNTTISDVLVFNPSEHTYNDIVTMIRGQSIIGNGGYKSIGILQHNMRLPYYQCLKTGNKCTLISVAAIDSTLSSWSDYIDFITALKTEFSISFLDLLACALYSDPNWKYVIDQIADRLQIVIRASTDDTGAAELGGDWYLESHTGVNLKDVYFTDAIESYADLLLIGTPNNIELNCTFQIPTFSSFPSRPSRPPLITTIVSAPSLPSRPTIPNISGGNVVAWGSDNIGVAYSSVSSSLQSGVVYLYAWYNGGAALKADGALIKWGKIRSDTTTQYNTLVPNTASLSSGVVSMVTAADSAFALKSDGSVVGWGLLTDWGAYPSELSSGVNFISACDTSIVCLKSDGSVKCWGVSMPVVPTTLYPEGSNINSNVVKVASGGLNHFAALKSDGSVVYWASGSTWPAMDSAYTGALYPTGSNISSGVIDICVTFFHYIALKSNGTVVVWGPNSSGYNTALAGITNAVKIIKLNNGETAIIMRSDGTYLRITSGYITTGSAGSDTDVVDIIEGEYSRQLFLRNNGLIAWRGGENFGYYYSVDISVFTDVVKIYNFNWPYHSFGVNAVILKSNGELRTLANNTLITTNVNDMEFGGRIGFCIKSDGTTFLFGDNGSLNNNTSVASSLTSNVVFARTSNSVFTVLKMNPAPTLSSFYASGISKTYGDAAFDLTDPSSNNLTGAFTYTSSNTNVAIITGGGSSKNITIVGAGTATITATQASTSDYATGTITTTLTVALGTPTLSSSTFTVRSSATYGAVGDISFGITTAPTSNNTDVSITYASNDTNVATINASTGVITPVGFGTVTFTANQVAVANKYNAASVTSNSLSVARGTTTLSRVSMSSSISKTFGIDSATFDVSANSASSGAITYYSSNPSFATVNINTGSVTLVAAGETIITAQQAQTLQYNAPTDISSSLVVNRGTTTLSRVAFDPTISKTYGDSTFSVSVSSASSGTKTYTSSDLSCATVDSNGLVTLVASGSTTITISQAQSGQYNAPTDISSVLTVERGTPVLTRSTFPTTLAKTYGNPSFSLVVTSSNTDIPVEYRSGTPGVATVNLTTGQVTLVSSGSTTITASQPQTSRYYAPTSITLVLDVSRGNVTLTGFPTNLSKNVTDLSFAITATSDSSGAIVYESNNSSVATINTTSGLVTLKGPGTATLTANQSQTALYNAPTAVSCTLVVSAAGNALAGQVVSSGRSFAGVNLAGASLAGSTVSGVNFAGAVLSSVNLSGAVITNTDFTGADISGANITGLTFSPLQKIQLLKNANNREIGAIQVQDVSASDILSIVPQNSPLLQLPNVTNLDFKVIIPPTATSINAPVENATIAETAPAFYMPVNEGEYFKINDVKYYIDGTNIKNAITNTDVSVLSNSGNYYRVFGGSMAGIVLDLTTYTIQGATLRDILKLGSGSGSGATGPVGATGANGPIGLTGLIGSTGSTGPIGETGPIGPIGLTGLIGSTGSTGPIGPIGLTGLIGSTGSTGPIGATGAIGLTGLIGSTGSTGPIGATGAIGPNGIQGSTGPSGVSATAPAAYGTYRITDRGTVGDYTITRQDGSLTVSNSSFVTLTAGLTYELTATIAIRCTFAVVVWQTEAGVTIGNGGQFFSTNSTDPGVTSPAYAIYTPTTNTNVKLRLTSISGYSVTTTETGQISIIQLTGQGPSGATGPAGPASSITSVSSSDSTITTTTTSGAVNLSIPISLRPASVSAGYYTFNESTWNTLGFDFQNYDYEATFEFSNLSSSHWLYFYWNNNNNASHSGTMVYAPPTTAGGNESFNTTQGGSYDSNPYTLYSGNTNSGSGVRNLIATYRFRGLSATHFAMNIVGRPNLYWPSFATNIPQYAVYKCETTYYNNNNGGNWGPTTLRIASTGTSYSGKMVWTRLNKT
jgi:uncharacterized protein YjbI with pentapeptide repeats/uncharacterized protein YjdB